jgi:predicted HNH restriction endonuclease
MPLRWVFGSPKAARIARATQSSGHSIVGRDADKLAEAWRHWVRHYGSGETHHAGASMQTIGDRSIAHYFEGRPSRKLVTQYERDQSLKKRLVASLSLFACACCGMRPDARFGEAFSGKLLEIHHLEQLSNGPRNSKLADVALLCPNCHRAVHTEQPPIHPLRLRKMLRKAERQLPPASSFSV